MAKKLTDEQKTKYIKIACALSAEIAMTDEAAELIWRSYEGVQKLGGDFSVDDAVKIKYLVSTKYEEKNKQKS